MFRQGRLWYGIEDLNAMPDFLKESIQHDLLNYDRDHPYYEALKKYLKKTTKDVGILKSN